MNILLAHVVMIQSFWCCSPEKETSAYRVLRIGMYVGLRMRRGALHNKKERLLPDDSSRDVLPNKFASFAISTEKGKLTVWMQPPRRCKTAKQ